MIVEKPSRWNDREWSTKVRVRAAAGAGARRRGAAAAVIRRRGRRRRKVARAYAVARSATSLFVVAQTKKRRQTKHRGNAAGMVEARGRTGRKPTDGERKLDAKAEGRRRREERMNRPPTWSGAL